MRQVLIVQPIRQHQRGAAPRAPRLVQLVGRQGPDKIAIAVQAAACFRHHFPDGQFYVNAHPDARGSADLIDRLLCLFGLGPAGRDTTNDQAAWLRSALGSRRALLVLDNVADADHVRPLLTTGGTSAIMILASRPLNGLDGIWTIDADLHAADGEPAAVPAPYSGRLSAS
ncbi:hypothetical protein [Sphaerisporangium krabiense]|uniref:Putative ATPase n=1 Tax=Sphaerisporangium krabiense TaxID=763782 RepID=A0A7W8Z4Z9_9ACTN|nr:hypothetical protein [Sphaerisporangium krabiense]MBB5627500.1 putative ATPase [Sphaerisporangium krabiense]